MTVRQLDGFDDIQVAIGALSGMTHGTVVVIVKRTALTGFDSLFVAHDSGGSRRLQLGFAGIETNWYPGSGAVDSRGPSVANTTDWWLIVARKATGTAAPRYSVYNYAGDTWAHADGSNAVPDSAIPGAGGTVRCTMQGGEHLAALVAARAAWSNSLPWSADASGDTAVEAAGLETAYQNWLDASPEAAWRFNQASTSTAVVDDTGNGADQVAITGTTVVTGDDPPGFDSSLGAEPAEGTVALGFGLGLAAAGSRLSAGVAGYGVGLELAADGARDSAGVGDPAIGVELAASGVRPSQGTAAFTLGLALAGSTIVVAPTPSQRTLAIPADPRTLGVPAQPRTQVIGEEDRRVVVPA